jgi:hypothetical protein
MFFTLGPGCLAVDANETCGARSTEMGGRRRGGDPTGRAVLLENTVLESHAELGMRPRHGLEIIHGLGIGRQKV